MDMMKGSVMVIWRISHLIELLKEHKLTSTQQRNYLIFAFMFLALFPIMYMKIWVETVIVGLIILFGINLAYMVNTRGDGKDFITRFTVLSCPIALRILLLRILVIIIEIFMITGSMLAPFPYQRVKGVPLKYAVNFIVSLPEKIMQVMYNPPEKMGDIWLIFHRVIPLLLLILFFVWIAYAMFKVSKKI